MRRLLLRTGPLVVLCTASLWAGPCLNTTLDQYELLPSSGCTAGGLIFENFNFSVLSSAGGATVISASQVNVLPIFTRGVGLSFTSNGWSVSSGQSVSYLLSYTIDPSGPIRSVDDVLDDPVTAPGLGTISSLVCVGALFSPTCGTFTVSLNVFDDGVAPHLTDFQAFAGVSEVDIQDTIILNAASGGSVKINGFSSSVVPEPETGWLAAAALGLVLWRRGAGCRAG